MTTATELSRKKECVFFPTITSDWLVYRLSYENHSVFGSVLTATLRPRSAGLHQAMGSMCCAVHDTTMVTYDWCITNLTGGWWVSPRVELFLTISRSKKKGKMRRLVVCSRPQTNVTLLRSYTSLTCSKQQRNVPKHVTHVQMYKQFHPTTYFV